MSDNQELSKKMENLSLNQNRSQQNASVSKQDAAHRQDEDRFRIVDRADASASFSSYEYKSGQNTSKQQLKPQQQQKKHKYVAPLTDEEFHSEFYKKAKYPGRAIIIHNEKFQKRLDGQEGAFNRTEQKIDKDRVIECLQKLNFRGVKIQSKSITDHYGHADDSKPSVFIDVTKTDLLNILEEAADNDFSDYSCFMCVILSYGDTEPGIVYCPGKTTNDEACEMKEMLEFFKGHKCPQLAMKPKVFFVQADDNYIIKDGRDDIEGEEKKETETRKIPRECNFLTQFSTVPAKCNIEESRASLYITALCEGLHQHWKQEQLDLLKVLTRINNRFQKLAKDKKFKDDYGKIDLKYPLVTSLLIKRFCV